MRIAHLITFGELPEAADLGGAQANTVLSIRHQMKMHDVELIAGCDGPLVDRCRAEGIPITVIPISNKVISPLDDIRSVVSLWRYFRRAKPDFVHTHCNKAGVVGRVAAWLARVPVVIHTIHNYSFHRRQNPVIYQALRLAEWVCARLAAQLISVSSVMAREFAEAGICSVNRIKVVVSGIDFTRFTPHDRSHRGSVRDSLGIDASSNVVINVANLMRDKGHELLVEAAAILKDRRVQTTFVVVGAGPLEEQIRSHAANLGVADSFKLLGRRDDVPSLLQAADIFAQSSYREGISRSLVEAMFCGLAVVATNAGGTREVVVDEETGLLVATGDARAIADAIQRLLGSQELRTQLGQAAHLAVAEGRTVEAMTHALDEIYGELAEQRGLAAVNRVVTLSEPSRI